MFLFILRVTDNFHQQQHQQQRQGRRYQVQHPPGRQHQVFPWDTNGFQPLGQQFNETGKFFENISNGQGSDLGKQIVPTHIHCIPNQGLNG